MNPILKIIHYLFQKKNYVNNDDTFNSFFQNGVAFPMFVAIAFNIDEIPNINKNPESISNKNMNNKIALQYLFNHNKSIAKMSPSYTTEQDKASLLLLILTNQCFQIDLPLLINKCNLIVKPLGINFNNKSDLLSLKCILSLLNVLTDGKVPIVEKASNFDSLIKNSFDIAKAPLVIDQTSMNIRNRFIFYIQLEIILDFFSEKVNKIVNYVEEEQKEEVKKDGELELEKNEGKEKEDKKEEESSLKKNEEEDKKENLLNLEKSVEEQENEKEEEQKNEEEEEQKNEEEDKKESLLNLEKRVEEQENEKEEKQKNEEEEEQKNEEEDKKESLLNLEKRVEEQNNEKEEEQKNEKEEEQKNEEEEEEQKNEKEEEEQENEEQQINEEEQVKEEDKNKNLLYLEKNKEDKEKEDVKEESLLDFDKSKEKQEKGDVKKEDEFNLEKNEEELKNEYFYALVKSRTEQEKEKVKKEEELILEKNKEEHEIEDTDSFFTSDELTVSQDIQIFSDFESSSDETETEAETLNIDLRKSTDSDISSEQMNPLPKIIIRDTKSHYLYKVESSDHDEISDFYSDYDQNDDDDDDDKEEEKEDQISSEKDSANSNNNEIDDEDNSDANKSFKKLFGSLRRRDNDVCWLETLYNKKLLKVISAIENKEFKTYRQAIENDEIPKFVMNVLKRKSIKGVTIETNKPKKRNDDKVLTESELNNINSIIKYLKQKEQKFKVLMFNFKSAKFIEASTILFYRTFIKAFFVKNSKEEIFERCVTLIYDKIVDKKNINNHILLLTDWNMYINLIHFIKEKSLNTTSIRKLGFHAKEYFKSANIPLIIDENFLKICSNQKQLPISIYCQLKFIFNRIDEVGGSYHIIELFKRKTREIKQMNFPKIESLSSIVREKNISLLLQKQSYQNYQARKDAYKDNDDIKQSTELEKQLALPPPPFNSRAHTLEIKKQLASYRLSLQQIKSAKSFWNKPDQTYSFENGIMYHVLNHFTHKDESQKKWINEIESIQQKCLKNKFRINLNKTHHLPIAKTLTYESINSKLYKFFIYNEDKNKWEFNMDTFYIFSREKKISINEMKTPLVLFLNSFEEDLRNVTVNLGLLIGKYPDLDDQNIYVYGIADRSFLRRTSLNNETEMIKPILLFLHVPENKKNLVNISLIIFQIYTFLCFICDIEIIVLNKEFYNDQIDITKIINKISLSYHLKDQVEILSEFNVLSASDSSDDENEIIEDDSSENYDDIDAIGNDDVDDDAKCGDDIHNLAKIGNKVFKKKRKMMLLVIDENDGNKKNHDNFKEIEKEFNKNSFFSNMKSGFDSFICQMNYINIRNLNLNESFTENFTNFVFYDDNSTFDDVSRNFRFINLSEISNKYIRIKNEENWEQKLSELINKRYKIIKDQDTMCTQYLTNLTKLRKEIIENSPSFDIEFENKCHTILLEIKTKESQNNQKNFIAEIENSSKLNLKYLKDVISSELYWKNEDIENLICSHIQFLKDEFFHIIKLFYDKKLIKPIYEENKCILYDQIKKDADEIRYEYFYPFTEAESLKQTIKVRDVDYKKKRGTNYAIREFENTREIKVTVQINDDLTSKIKQDF